MSENNNKLALLLLQIIGVVSLLIGTIAAIASPTEIYCYYLFSEGGRFYYEGFGFGSFLFGNITLQIFGYYILAIVFIPLGYGHVKRKAWTPKVSLTLLWSWIIVGIPLLLVLLFIIVTYKEPSVIFIIISVVFLVLCYTVLPFFLIKFYKSEVLHKALSTKARMYWINQYPVAVLVTIVLYLFHVVIFHALLFHKGLFPFFGMWLVDLGVFSPSSYP